MKVNLCAGTMLAHGYVNVDAYPGPGIDVVCDARDLQYPENSLDEVVWFHAIEHFTLDDARTLIARIFHWLKPGGHLLIEGPDVVKAVKNAKDEGDLSIMQDIFGSLIELRAHRDGYQHLWGWTGALCAQELSRVGFAAGPVEDGISHDQPWRDYRVVGFKPK